MDCPNCHTYNPEDRTVCWRCDKPLPKPVVKKKKSLSSQQWLYILVAVTLILMVANFCGLPKMLNPTQPTGYLGSFPAAMLLVSPWLLF